MQTMEIQSRADADRPASDLPLYEPPAMVTFTDEQLLEALGPAQAARYA